MAIKIATGGSSPGKLLNNSDFSSFLRQQQILLLLGIGLIGAVLHASFRWPLQLPGHHGLEWMALLVLARSLSPCPRAASIAAIGAAATSLLPPLGFHNPLIAVDYLLSGLLLDVLTHQGARWRSQTLVLAVSAALAHASKPLLHWLLSTTLGWKFGSLIHGLGYPLFTHLLFGLSGGLVGAWLWHRYSYQR